MRPFFTRETVGAAAGSRPPAAASRPGMSRGRALLLLGSTAVAGAAGAAYLFGHDPHDPGRPLPFCPWNRVTGLLCPACGSTRATYHLLHGEWAAAFADNAALLLTTPVLAAFILSRLAPALRGGRFTLAMSRPTVALVLSLAAAWTVARNIFG